MHWLDIIIAIALLVAAVVGLWQGFVKTLLSLVGLIVGVIVASNFYGALAERLTFIANPNVANIVSFIILLLAVMVLAALVAMALRALLRAIMLGWIDRLAGAVLGLFFGILLAGTILAVVVKVLGQGLVTESVLAAILLDKTPLVLGLLPREFETIRGFFR